MKNLVQISILLIFSFPALSQTDAQKLLELDLAWEKALLTSDVSFLENVLADDFIWVHDHASLIDGKKEVVNQAKRIQNGQKQTTRNRLSSDQKVIMLGQTAIVTGFTLVDRGPSPTTYNFMRTYAKIDGKFKLLANHTMAIPKE
ncbi:nuclear transport factor 2 family protein [Algoriphagus sp.]|uniref:nuclear transport factor 2 family protein n=1 Tax=Algoriphagus sp. TaxID=1872435 RepID=UPI002602F2F8|nr:nuclear transport factor 2 family protein [Algoriphagus sp.]